MCLLKITLLIVRLAAASRGSVTVRTYRQRRDQINYPGHFNKQHCVIKLPNDAFYTTAQEKLVNTVNPMLLVFCGRHIWIKFWYL